MIPFKKKESNRAQIAMIVGAFRMYSVHRQPAYFYCFGSRAWSVILPDKIVQPARPDPWVQ